MERNINPLDTDLGPAATNNLVMPDEAIFKSCRGEVFTEDELFIGKLLYERYENDNKISDLNKEVSNLEGEVDAQKKKHTTLKKVCALATATIVAVSAYIGYGVGQKSDSIYLYDAEESYSQIISDNSHRTGPSNEYYYYDAEGIINNLKEEDLKGDKLDLAVYTVFDKIPQFEGGSGKEAVDLIVSGITDGEYSGFGDFVMKKYGLDFHDEDFMDKYFELMTSIAKTDMAKNLDESGKGVK